MKELIHVCNTCMKYLQLTCAVSLYHIVAADEKKLKKLGN